MVMVKTITIKQCNGNSITASNVSHLSFSLSVSCSGCFCPSVGHHPHHASTTSHPTRERQLQHWSDAGGGWWKAGAPRDPRAPSQAEKEAAWQSSSEQQPAASDQPVPQQRQLLWHVRVAVLG